MPEACHAFIFCVFVLVRCFFSWCLPARLASLLPHFCPLSFVLLSLQEPGGNHHPPDGRPTAGRGHSARRGPFQGGTAAAPEAPCRPGRHPEPDGFSAGGRRDPDARKGIRSRSQQAG
ncbi:unnamed protein product [Ixodes pacificus]